MKVARIVVVILFVSSSAYAQNPLSRLKALQDDGIAEPLLAALNNCLPLAPFPVGAFVPPDFPLTILAQPVPLPVLGGVVTLPAFAVPIPGAAFLPPPPRICTNPDRTPLSTRGISAGSPPQPPGQSTFTFTLNADYSTFRTNGSNGGGCSNASGRLTYTKDSNGNNEQLVMTHAGVVCDTAGPLGSKVYTATYNITGGSRKYVGAAGTGNLSVSFNSTETLVHLFGNVLFR